jgi:hypothetical protein
MSGLRPLMIDDAARAKIARVVAYAMDHPYIPGPRAPVPGDDPHFVAHLNTYRAVFTFTHSAGKVYRHLSISVPGKGYPNPAAAFLIASEFGFTGWDEKQIDRLPEGWLMDVNDADHCVVLGQECGKAR